MPKYDYKCNDEQCGEIFEITQGFSDEPYANCIVCGHSSKRLISKVAVHFKGSGWYSTDNTSKSELDKTKDPKKDSTKDESVKKPSKKKSTKKNSANTTKPPKK